VDLLFDQQMTGRLHQFRLLSGKGKPDSDHPLLIRGIPLLPVGPMCGLFRAPQRLCKIWRDQRFIFPNLWGSQPMWHPL